MEKPIQVGELETNEKSTVLGIKFEETFLVNTETMKNNIFVHFQASRDFSTGLGFESATSLNEAEATPLVRAALQALTSSDSNPIRPVFAVSFREWWIGWCVKGWECEVFKPRPRFRLKSPSEISSNSGGDMW